MTTSTARHEVAWDVDDSTLWGTWCWPLLVAVAVAHVALIGLAATSGASPPPQAIVPPVVMAQLLPMAAPQPVPETVTKPRVVPKPAAQPESSKPAPVKRPSVPKPVPAPLPAANPVPGEKAVSAPQAPPQPAPSAPTLAEPATPSPPSSPATSPPSPVTAPRFDAAYLNNPAPAYPATARRMGEEGRVLLRVFVTPDGTAGEVRVQSSSGSHLLDEAALAAVRQWRFVPARQGSAPVGAWVQVPLAFKLN